MAIKTVTLTVPDPDQPLSELTPAEKLQAFQDLGDVVGRLDTRRRALHIVLTAAAQRNKAKQLIEQLSPELRQAMKTELGLL